MENGEKRKNIWTAILVILFLLLALSLIHSKSYTPSKELVLDETYEIKDIVIKSDAANVTIKETDEQIIKVKIYGDKNNTNVEDYDKITIETKMKNCKFLCLKNRVASIEISLPKDYDNKLKINDDYGNLNIGKFEDGDFDIELDSGKVNIDEVSNIVLDIDAGDANIRKVNRKLDIDIDAGNLKINELELEGDSSINMDAGSIEIGKTNDIYFDVKSDVAEVNINNNNRKSELTLTIRIDIGSINVNN